MRRLLAAFAFALVACGTVRAEPATGESDLAEKPPKEWTPSAVKAGNLRIATWNIRNFPKDALGQADGAPPEEPATPDTRSAIDTDLEMAAALLDKLDFDVLGVQEIDDVAAFEALLARVGEKNGRRYQGAFSTEWPHVQHVGIVVRADRLRIDAPKIHADVATRPTLRAGFSARITSLHPGGADFGMMVLHLASGANANRAALRATQASFAAKAVAERRAEFQDDDFVVLGDFNSALEDQEMPGLDTALAGDASGLVQQKTDSACTAYYDEDETGPVLPTTIDHVYLASMSERDVAVPLVAGAHCAERSCMPFESAGRESGTSFWGVSDHCPVYFEIADEDRD